MPVRSSSFPTITKMVSRPLSGKVALVTGASRGIGQGIALQLGQAGATVYITGRLPAQSENGKAGLGTLEATANDVTDRGGKGIPVFVDHTDMEQVKNLFARIERETNGKLDILVNNAYAAVSAIFDSAGKKFYEQEPEFWDVVNNVGLRNHYFCSVYAARIMVANGRGLIVNVSSQGGLKYIFNVAYGVGKAAFDRMAADMAIELKSSGVAAISLWPGPVRTQLVERTLEKGTLGEKVAKELYTGAETIEFTGKAIVALATDPKVIQKTGRVITTADVGDEYGFVDIDGLRPSNFRSLSTLLRQAGWHRTADSLPYWIKVPGWILTAVNSSL